MLDPDLIITAKYIGSYGVIAGVWIAPSYLANRLKKNKTDQMIVNASSIMFGWTGVGWLFALYWAAKK
jgi:hypothetical protein